MIEALLSIQGRRGGTPEEDSKIKTEPSQVLQDR